MLFNTRRTSHNNSCNENDINCKISELKTKKTKLLEKKDQIRNYTNDHFYNCNKRVDIINESVNNSINEFNNNNNNNNDDENKKIIINLNNELNSLKDYIKVYEEYKNKISQDIFGINTTHNQLQNKDDEYNNFINLYNLNDKNINENYKKIIEQIKNYKLVGGYKLGGIERKELKKYIDVNNNNSEININEFFALLQEIIYDKFKNFFKMLENNNEKVFDKIKNILKKTSDKSKLNLNNIINICKESLKKATDDNIVIRSTKFKCGYDGIIDYLKIENEIKELDEKIKKLDNQANQES
jgi:hypothetical protein